MKATMKLRLDPPEWASEPDEDGEHPGWRNATLTVVRGRRRVTTDVGGGWLLTGRTAREINGAAGLQPEEHPEMYWPGAVRAGDFEPYEISDGDVVDVAELLGLEPDHVADMVWAMSLEAARSARGLARREVEVPPRR